MRIAEALGVPAESDIDVTKNRAELYVTDEDRPRFDRALRARGVQLPEHVAAVTVDELGVPEASYVAGLKMYPGNVPADYCTSGFTMRFDNGREGTTTAGHCRPNPNPGTMYTGGTRLPFIQQDLTGSQDVQVHYTPGYDDKARFIDGDGRGSGTRAVYRTKGRAYQRKGDVVCKYGRRTGYTCGRIVSRYFAPPWVNHPNNTFMRVAPSGSNMSSGGDSGGPYFYGNTALGLHSGSPSDGTQSVYMAINYVSSGAIPVRRVQVVK